MPSGELFCQRLFSVHEVQLIVMRTDPAVSPSGFPLVSLLSLINVLLVWPLSSGGRLPLSRFVLVSSSYIW